MSDSGNVRIAKNTVFLYIRLLLLLVISLYTSRIVLQVLGIDDYGIYNVVGGVIVMFSFVNGALTIGTQRHLSFERGKEVGEVSKVFSACFRIHLFYGIVILVLSETLGLWFVNTQLNIPEGRMDAANFVYQFAILSSLLNIIRAPLEATVIAYEKMSFYAYLGILEGIFKLLIAFSLFYFFKDKLIAFSFLHFLTCAVVVIALWVFISRYLSFIRFVHITDRSLYRYLLSFSGWTLLGALSTLIESQGLNIVTNIFWGVAVNAAVGIAVQVRGALAQFVSGFQQALNPQLVMSQSGGDKGRQFDLIFKSSKFSFFIFFVLALPLCFNLPFVLDLWLDTVPKYTSEICYFIIIVQLIESLSSPLYTTIYAVGFIRNYQITVFLVRCISIVSGLVLGKLNVAPYLVFLVPCIVAVALLFYRLFYVSRYISLPKRAFLKSVIIPVSLVCTITLLPLGLYKLFLDTSPSFLRFICESLFIALLSASTIYCLGLTKTEKKSLSRVIVLQLQKLHFF